MNVYVNSAGNLTCATRRITIGMKREDVIEIDLVKLGAAVLHRIWAVILAAVICATVAFGLTYIFVEPTYVASTLLYVNNNTISVGSTSFSISSGSLTAAQELVNTYIVILKARTSLNEIIETAGLTRSAESLKHMISAQPVNSTEIFEISVTSTDPQEAELIANTIAKVLPKKIAEIVDGSSVRIVDYAIVPSSRSGPSYSRRAMIGFLIGLVLSVAVIVIRVLFDNFIREEQYITQTYDYPILASIPDLRVTGNRSGGGYYGYRAERVSAETEEQKEETEES